MYQTVTAAAAAEHRRDLREVARRDRQVAVVRRAVRRRNTR
jgi:hypothetical protein